MKALEYVLSLGAAILILGAAVVWSHADYAGDTVRQSCRSGAPNPAVTMKGLVVYPRCGAGKRS